MPRDTSRLDQAVYAIRDIAEAKEGSAEELNALYRPNARYRGYDKWTWDDDVFENVIERISREADNAFPNNPRAAHNYIYRAFGQDPVIMAGMGSIPRENNFTFQPTDNPRWDEIYAPERYRVEDTPESPTPRRTRTPRPARRPAGMAVPDELLVNDIMTERAGLLPTSSRAARLGAMGRRAVRALPVVGAAAEAAVTANNIRNEGLSRGLQRTGADTIDATADLAGGLGRVYWPAQLAEAGLRGLTGAYHRREEREARQELTDEELEALLLERSR